MEIEEGEVQNRNRDAGISHDGTREGGGNVNIGNEVVSPPVASKINIAKVKVLPEGSRIRVLPVETEVGESFWFGTFW